MSEQMTLTGHLKEFRQRLIRSAVAVTAAFAATYYYSDVLLEILAKPLIEALPEGSRFMAFTAMGEPFFTYLKVGMYSAVLLASPYVLFQAWGFVAPALYEEEKKWFFPLVFVSTALFLFGAVFAYVFVFPIAFKYLLSFSTPELKPFISMGEYFSTAAMFLVVFGAVFQLPLVMAVTAKLGLVSGKTYIAYWRYAIVVIFIAAAILTPPDVVSQLLLGLPMLGLYFIGAVFALMLGKRQG
ncbi:MAG: twin-arginine translocase subunit TatC [Thermodesulfobacteriota bacterium]